MSNETISFGWWVFYGTFRATNNPAWLFNIKAATMDEAINKGARIYKAMPETGAIRRLYTIAPCTARPLNREQCEILDSREGGAWPNET